MRVYLKTGKQKNMQLKLRISNWGNQIWFDLFLPYTTSETNAVSCLFPFAFWCTVGCYIRAVWGLPYQGRRESGKRHFQKTWFLDCLTVVKVTSEALQTAVIQNSRQNYCFVPPYFCFFCELQNWRIWQSIEIGNVRPNFVFLKG